MAILSNAPDRPPSKKKRQAEPVLSSAVTEKLEAAKKLARKMDKKNPGAAAAVFNSKNSNGSSATQAPNQKLTPAQVTNVLY